MSTMKAALIEAQNSEFKIADIARPSPQASQILVRIKAAALNPLDLKIRAGEAAHARHPLPASSASIWQVSWKRSAQASKAFALVTKSMA